MKEYQHRTTQYWKLLRRSKVLSAPAEKMYTSVMDSAPQHCTGLLVLSPAMNAYVIWILRKAVQTGMKRLYFLARDGYLVYATAKEYCKKLDLPIECRYIYCSRYSLRVPLYHLDLSEALEHICRGGICVTPRKIMIRSGFSQKEIDEILPQLNLSYKVDECIPFARLAQVQESLRNNKTYMSAVASISARALPALKGYFAQEGLLDNCSMAIVDSGWTGTMQKYIQQIRQLCGCHNDICGFYYGIYSLPHGASTSQYSAFAFSRWQHLWRKVFFNNNFFETVFSSPHGSTRGYNLENGKYTPILSQPDPRIKGFIMNLEEQMASYTDKLLMDMSLQQFRQLSLSQLQRIVCALFRLLMWDPTPQEADYFGSLPFSDDLLDSGIQELAAPLSEQQLHSNHLLPKLLSMTGLRPRPLHESAWYEASAVRCSPHPRWDRINYTLYRVLLYLKPR